jgi:hypothetical protein
MMQALNQAQGDAVLDLTDQCFVVAHAWEQRRTHQGITPKSSEISGYRRIGNQVRVTHEEALKLLKDIYAQCVELGVRDDILVGVLMKMLPKNYTEKEEQVESD